MAKDFEKAAKQRPELSPGRVCEPWVRTVKTERAAKRQIVIDHGDELCRCSAASYVIPYLTQGSQTRPGPELGRRSADLALVAASLLVESLLYMKLTHNSLLPLFASKA